MKTLEGPHFYSLFIPKITIILITINIIVFITINFFNKPISFSETISCFKSNYPQCLEIASEKYFLDCANKFGVEALGEKQKSAHFEENLEVCKYNLKTDCLNQEKITFTCFSFKDNIPHIFGFVPLSFGKFPFSIITSMFLHGNWSHLIFNMFFLLFAGSFVENRIGRKKFLLFYLISGICASLFYLFFNKDSYTPAIGASGAIFGLLGAIIVLSFYFNKRTQSQYYIFDLLGKKIFSAIGLLLFFFYYQLLIPLLGPEEYIGYSAHIGGFIAGFILIFFFKDKNDLYQSDEIS